MRRSAVACACRQAQQRGALPAAARRRRPALAPPSSPSSTLHEVLDPAPPACTTLFVHRPAVPACLFSWGRGASDDDEGTTGMHAALRVGDGRQQRHGRSKQHCAAGQQGGGQPDPAADYQLCAQGLTLGRCMLPEAHSSVAASGLQAAAVDASEHRCRACQPHRMQQGGSSIWQGQTVTAAADRHPSRAAFEPLPPPGCRLPHAALRPASTQCPPPNRARALLAAAAARHTARLTGIARVIARLTARRRPDGGRAQDVVRLPGRRSCAAALAAALPAGGAPTGLRSAPRAGRLSAHTLLSSCRARKIAAGAVGGLHDKLHDSSAALRPGTKPCPCGPARSIANQFAPHPASPAHHACAHTPPQHSPLHRALVHRLPLCAACYPAGEWARDAIGGRG